MASGICRLPATRSLWRSAVCFFPSSCHGIRCHWTSKYSKNSLRPTHAVHPKCSSDELVCPRGVERPRTTEYRKLQETFDIGFYLLALAACPFSPSLGAYHTNEYFLTRGLRLAIGDENIASALDKCFRHHARLTSLRYHVSLVQRALHRLSELIDQPAIIQNDCAAKRWIRKVRKRFDRSVRRGIDGWTARAV